MNYKLFIKANNKKYEPAIRRYLKYIFNIESSVLEKNKILDDSIILIDEDVSIDEDWIDFLHKYSNIKIIILGLSRKSSEVYVNLLDLAHLKLNIQSVLNQKKTTVFPILLLKNMEQKIRSLFKGHGEKSIVDLLNITRQALSSGPNLLKQNILEWGEYKESYLKPGLENWEAFKNRLRKHEIYLKVCGFNNEMMTIKYNIDKFQLYMDKLKLMKKDQINRMNDDKIKQNTDCLNQIDSILLRIKQKIDSIYDAE